MGRVLRFKRRKQQSEDPDIAILAGLGGVAVVIEDFDSVFEKAGLNRTTLQLAVEQQLSEGGVPVLTLQQAEESDDAAYLVVAVGADSHPTGVVASMLNLQLCEFALLPRGDELDGGVTTWRINGVWAVDKQNLAESMNDAIGDGLKRLVRDYRRANA